MHKKGFRAKKWIEISPNLGAKAMLFPTTRRTFPKKNLENFQPKTTSAKPRNMHF